MQSENNITKALINVFSWSHRDLINNFLIQVVKISPSDLISYSRMDYDLQIKKSFVELFRYAIVIGIQNDEVRSKWNSNVEISEVGVADAAIMSDDQSLCVLIEVKVGKNSIKEEQIKRHENLFLKGQKVEPHFIITWAQIINFLREQSIHLSGEQYIVTKFLIEQFISFCSINGLGKDKHSEYYLQSISLKVRPLAREINNYITETYAEDLSDWKSNSGGIGYKRKTGSGFFAKLESNEEVLILVTDDATSLQITERMGHLLRERKKYHPRWNPSTQVWVDLYKIRSVLEIKDLIEMAYSF